MVVPGVWGSGTVVRTLGGTRGMGPGGVLGRGFTVFSCILPVFGCIWP